MDTDQILRELKRDFHPINWVKVTPIKKPRVYKLPLRPRFTPYHVLKEKYPEPWWYQTMLHIRFALEGKNFGRTYFRMTQPPRRRSRHK